MQNILTILFAINLSLLFVHEMEAIRFQEWKMFIVLKGMEDKRAYLIFLLLHIPLYTLIIWLLLSPFFKLGFYITDIFLMAHLILHLCFLQHKSNKLNNALSMSIIVLMGTLSTLHFIGTLLAV
ncbi:DUF6713 family protein [Clostridioides difficile]